MQIGHAADKQCTHEGARVEKVSQKELRFVGLLQVLGRPVGGIIAKGVMDVSCQAHEVHSEGGKDEQGNSDAEWLVLSVTWIQELQVDRMIKTYTSPEIRVPNQREQHRSGSHEHANDAKHIVSHPNSALMQAQVLDARRYAVPGGGRICLIRDPCHNAERDDEKNGIEAECCRMHNANQATHALVSKMKAL